MPDHPKSKRVESGLIAGGIVVMVAVSGYFVGLRQTNSAIAMTRAVSVIKEDTHRDLTGATDVPVAVRYIDQDWSKNGPNAEWRNSLVDFRQPAAAVPDANAPVAPEVKHAVLQARADRRAYDGAPPVVPHPITQDSSAACLACHGQGLQVKDRFASKISHPTFGGSCTQCHVSSQGTFTAAEAAVFAVALSDNSFQGAGAPLKGPRAWPGAPPLVPHRTFMRNDCMSCHGPNGLFALRTPHPERQSCSQCHVSAAVNDQHQFLPAPPLDAVKKVDPLPAAAVAVPALPPAPALNHP
jgi:cytochrome c-type protein NapB